MNSTEWDGVVDDVFATFVDFWHDLKIEAKATDTAVANNGVQDDAFEWDETPVDRTASAAFEHFKEPLVPPNLANSLVQSATGGGTYNQIDAVWFSKHTDFGNGTLVSDETTGKQYKIMSSTKFEPVNYAEYQLKSLTLQGGETNGNTI